MSRTRRTASRPSRGDWPADFRTGMERGLVDMPKTDEFGDHVWAPADKKARKISLHRADRRAAAKEIRVAVLD